MKKKIFSPQTIFENQFKQKETLLPFPPDFQLEPHSTPKHWSDNSGDNFLKMLTKEEYIKE